MTIGKKINKSNTFDLLNQLIVTTFKLKYSSSLLGFVWVLLKPLLQFSILYTVFSRFAGNQQIQNFSIYLLIGIIFFGFFQEAINTGASSLLSRSNIILKVNFNRALAIYSTIILALVNMLINGVVILAFIILEYAKSKTFIDANIGSLLYVVYILIIATMFLTGVAYYTSVLAVKFRDLQFILEILVQLLFYATPIFYSVNILSGSASAFIAKNPIFILMQGIRAAIIQGQVVYLKEINIVMLISLVILISGHIFFRKNVYKVAEYF